MKLNADYEKSLFENRWAAFRMMVILFFVIGITALVFMGAYGLYTDNILYKERLGQMQEVTEQLFTGLEDVIQNQWYNADVQTNRICVQKPATTEQLLDFLGEQAELSKLEELNAELIVVDNRGRYYSQNGALGFLTEMDYLVDSPDRISFVSSTSTKEHTQMFFLERIDKPIDIWDGSHLIELTYCGIARDMKELNHYFNCKAYEGKNAVYVLDEQGTKLFSGNNGSSFLDGFNVYTMLQDMEYLHGSTFDSTLDTLHRTGTSYSNAVLNDEECYYALYQMDNAAWILLFMVSSKVVAVNTVSLVNSTTRLVVCFAFLMILLCSICIYRILRRQQKQVIQAEHRNSEVLEKVNADLAIAVEKAEKAEQTAKEASKAKSDFLANMSHDIRTPMNAIVGIASLMEHDKENPDKLDTYIHKIQKSSQHLLGLINDVLDMSKIESSDVSLNQEPVNLAEQIGQIDSIIRPQIEDHRQNFMIRVHEIRHEYLIGDAVRLRQIFINLLSNAVKYTPYGGTVTFDLAEEPCDHEGYATIHVTVTDTGYGMTPEFLKRVFEPFTRAENSTTSKIQGTGLGMAITKNIVDLMGGGIRVQSEVGKGTSFDVVLTLPVDRNIEHQINAKSVLLITEEKTLINNMRASLQDTDIEFKTAGTEPEAVALLEENKTDVIIMGGCLNNQTFADTVQLLRNKAKDAVLIFCCDYVRQEQVRDILVRSGVDGLISRPFFLSNFINAVNQAHSNVALVTNKDGFALDGMRFLCAEDNTLNAEILEAILDMNNASCKIYSDGAELVKAFASVKPGDYDAILMDVQMPNMNGLEAARAIRKGENPLGREIPIIAMTANAFSSDVQDCLDAGMDAHVSKPLQIAMLERALRNILNDGVRMERTRVLPEQM